MEPTTGSYRNQTAPDDPQLSSGLDQLREDCLLYNEAVGSYNSHLDNHLDRRNLHDIPFRDSITANGACEAALGGDPESIEDLLTDLIDKAHLDSQLRRHPRTYPIHTEAVEQLQIARDQLISTLEELLYHTRDTAE